MNKLNNKILLVEDEDILLSPLTEKLRLENFKVNVAKDGERGLQLALSEHPDIILLDILLPKSDGLEMLKKLRKDEWGKDARVIILTNLKDTDKINEMMSISLDIPNSTFDYIIKTDMSLDEIIDKIKLRLN